MKVYWVMELQFNLLVLDGNKCNISFRKPDAKGSPGRPKCVSEDKNSLGKS